MQRQSCNLVQIEIFGVTNMEIRTFLSWMQNVVEIIEPLSLLTVHSGIGGKDHVCRCGSGRQLSSENQVHATRFKVESKLTGGELPTFTSEQILHFYESRDNQLLPVVTQLFIGDSGQYLRPDGKLSRRESST